MGSIFGGGSDKSSRDASRAAQIQATSQREALDYLKEREEIPQMFREGSLTRLGGLYGLEGGEGSQEELIKRAIESPLYRQIVGGREEGEEAILRNMAATGGLRSGNIQEDLYDYNTQLENQALLSAYNDQIRGLTGLAGLPSNANQIAQLTTDIGTTLAQGKVAASQAEQDANQQLFNNIMGLGQLGLSTAGLIMYSDRRLKKNVKKVGELNGFNIYSFDWNSIARMLGLTGKTIGCMADEVFEIDPSAVFFKDDFLMVNYSKIGILPT